MSDEKSVGKSVTMPGRNGGSLRRGSAPGNTPGTGRPSDAIRAAMRELGATKALPFLSDLLDGHIPFTLVGRCPKCGKTTRLRPEERETLVDLIYASADQRLKAAEQAWKVGLGAKELVITAQNAASFFDCLYRAVVEQHGEDAAEAIKLRAIALMDAKP